MNGRYSNIANQSEEVAIFGRGCIEILGIPDRNTVRTVMIC